MKILAYSLFVLGPVMMVFSRPFTDSTNGALMAAGALVGMIGLFMRSRVRAGIPILSVTDEDRSEFEKMRQDARREFSIRKIVARFLGFLGGLCFLAGVMSVFAGNPSGRVDWRTGVALIVLSQVLLLCVWLLLRKPK
jgi:hypothetical protein